MKSQWKLWSCCEVAVGLGAPAPRCHTDSWRYNNLHDWVPLCSHCSLNGNKADEIMTQLSPNIELSYFCKDKNDLIKRCLRFNSFIYSLSCTFGCGTKLCWVWKHQTVPKFIPDSAARTWELNSGEVGHIGFLLLLNQTLFLLPLLLVQTSQSSTSHRSASVSHSFVKLFILCNKMKKGSDANRW